MINYFYSIYKNFNSNTFFNNFLFNSLSLFDLVILLIFILILFVIFLNFINNFFTKEKKIKFIKYIIKRLIISCIFFFFFNFSLFLDCSELLGKKKKDYFIISSSILITGVTGFLLYKNAKKFDLALKEVLPDLNKEIIKSNELKVSDKSVAVITRGLKHDDIYYFSVLRKNQEDLKSSIDFLRSNRSLDREMAVINSVSNYNIFKHLSIFNNKNNFVMFNNNKRLNENFFNRKLQNYEINNFDLCLTKIWALEQALINPKYNSIFTDKYIEIDYYALFTAQVNLKDAIMASYMTYKDLLLVSLNPFKSQDYYVRNLMYPFSVTKRYPYSNMPYPNGFQSINEFVEYKMDYHTFLQLVLFNFDLCTDKLLKNIHNYFLKLDVKFHERLYYSFDVKTQKLIYIERVKHSFNPIELNIPMPSNILTPVSVITNKLINNPEIFSFKLFFAKASVVFLYPVLFPLNKLFNISNPISFEMFSYSLLYFIKLKFLF